jgi:flagella basal body P-ring formation protein FlgA
MSIVKCSTALATCPKLPARLILLLWVLIVAAATTAHADPPLTVVLHHMNLVENGTLQLKNVADVFGNDTTQVARLQDLSLGRAPDPGILRTLKVAEVEKYCRHAGFSLSKIAISGAYPVLVSRANHPLPREALDAVVERYLHEHLSPPDINYRWKYAKQPKPLMAPAGSTIEVIHKPGIELQGRVVLQLGTFRHGTLVDRNNIRVNINTTETVWIANETIHRGTLITQDMIKPQSIETTHLAGDPRLSPELILGHQAKRTISSGRVITTDLIDIPYAVNRGDLITITTYGDFVVARVDGQARQDGRPGDWIWVVNLMTKGKMKAQVVGQQSVVVQ